MIDMKHIYRYILSALMLLTGTIAAFAYWEGSGEGINKNGTWYALYDNTEREIGLWEEKVYNLSAPGQTLTFAGKRTVLGAGNLQVNQLVGSNYSTIFEDNPGESEMYWEGWRLKTRINYVNYSAPVNVDATKLQFYAPTGATLKKYFKNVHVTMATYCAPASTATINFGEGQYMVTTDKTLKIYWCNVADNAVVSITGTDAALFSVNRTKVGSSVGKYGNTIITITYKRDNLPAGQTQKTHTATLQVNGQSITLTGKTIAVIPDITCPTLTNKVYSQSHISDFTWTGGSAKHPTLNTDISGTFAWVDPTEKADCHGKYQVRFTPDASLYGGGYTTATCEIDFEGHDYITPVAQTLTWVPLDVETVDEENRIYQIDGGRRLHAATNGDGEVRYKFISLKNLSGVEDASVADLLREDGGRFTNLIMNKPGTVVLEAWAESTCNYNESNHIQTTFLMPELINLLTDGVITPVCDPIIWGQTLQDANARGTAIYRETESLSENVPGHFEWLSPYYQPEVNESPGWDRKLRFVPDDRERFRIVTVDIKVIVKKRNTNITYISCPLWRGQSSYTHPFRSNNNESPYTVTVSPNDGVVSWNAATQSIVVGTVPTERQYTLTVTQAASAHYNAGTLTVTCWVRRRSDVCLPVVQFKNDYGGGTLNPEIYNKMRVSGEGTWSFEEKDDNKEEYFLYVANVKYTTHRGMQFGTWKDGFDLTSTLVLHINTSTEPVKTRLYFTGVPDAIDIKSKSESATTYTLTWDLPITWPISNRSWKVTESTNGTDFTSEIIPWTNGSELDHSNVRLNPDARYIEITYYGNFAGYIPAEDFQLTLRQQFEQGADRNKVMSIDIPQFGTEEHPLQVPQQVTFRYYGMGACGGTGERLKVVSDNEAFYADVEYIDANVGIDSWGEYTLTLRCTDVNKTGHITITPVDANDVPIRDPYGNLITPLKLNLSSAKPVITSDGTGIFYTGTEQNAKDENMYYRGMYAHDFADCFDGTTPLFDSLYIVGVTGNTDHVLDYYDPILGYHKPTVNTPDETTPCNAHTPLFVYYKSGNEYVYERTVQSVDEMLGEVKDADNRRLCFMGYCPFANTGSEGDEKGFVSFSSDVDVYLNNFVAYARAHTDNGTTADNPQDLTLYLGTNYIGGTGALMTFTAENTSIHLNGQNILRAGQGRQIGTATAVSRGISADVSALNGQQVPSSAIAFLPSSSDMAWNLSIDDVWKDDTHADGILFLYGSDGGGSIDMGNEHATVNIDNNRVFLADDVDESRRLSCRLFMAEKDGQGFSLYGVGEPYSPSADAWTAALPGYEAADAVDERKRLVVMGCEVAGLSPAAITNTGDYDVTQRQSLILTAPADTWQTMVAPFDITDVYVLEAVPEQFLEKADSKEDALTLQSTVMNDLLKQLKQELPASGPAADKSLVVLLSEWIGRQRDKEDNTIYTGAKNAYNLRGLWKLEHFDGTNIWSASWYLNELDSENESWQLSSEDGRSSFASSWRPAQRTPEGVLMQHGKTYAWQLPYCAHCTNYDGYDYWTDKWIIFEGYGSQTIDGTNSAANNLYEAQSLATGTTARFAGNTSFYKIPLSAEAYIHDQDPNSTTYDYFVARPEGTPVEAMTPALFLRSSSPSGVRAKAISRTGQVVYQEGEGVATDIETIGGSADNLNGVNTKARKMLINGEIIIVRDGEQYDVLGRARR